MAKPHNPSEVLPGTIFTQRQVHVLKWAVIVMGVVLVAGFVIIVSALVYQASRLSESAGPPASRAALSAAGLEAAVRVPEGMTISHMALADNQLALHLTGSGGAEIRIIDLGTGRLVARFPIESE